MSVVLCSGAFVRFVQFFVSCVNFVLVYQCLETVSVISVSYCYCTDHLDMLS